MTFISHQDILDGVAQKIDRTQSGSDLRFKKQHGFMDEINSDRPIGEQIQGFGENFREGFIPTALFDTFMGNTVVTEIEDQRARVQHNASTRSEMDYDPSQDSMFWDLPEEWQSRYFDVRSRHEMKVIHSAYVNRQRELTARNQGSALAKSGILAGELSNPGGVLSMLKVRSLKGVIGGTAAILGDEVVLQSTQDERSAMQSMLAAGGVAVTGGSVIGAVRIHEKLLARRYASMTDEMLKTERGIDADTLDDVAVQSGNVQGRFTEDAAATEFRRRQKSDLEDDLDEAPYGDRTDEDINPGDVELEGEAVAPLPKPSRADKAEGVDPDGEGLLPAFLLDRIPDGPLKRILNSENSISKTIVSELVENPFYQRMNRAEKRSAVGIDRKVAIRWVAPMVDTMRDTEKLFVRYRNRVSQTKRDSVLTRQLDDKFMRGQGDAMSFDDFLRAVGRSKRRLGDNLDDMPQEIIEAANLWNTKVYRPMGERAKATGLFTRAIRQDLSDKVDEFNAAKAARESDEVLDGLKKEINNFRAEIRRVDNSDLDPRYLNRIYMKDRIRQNRDEFREILIRHGIDEGDTDGVINNILGDRPRTPEEELLGPADDMLKSTDFTGKAASLRTRTLAHIPDEALEDFLEDNIFAVGKYYTTRVAPDVELMDQFGSVSLAPQIKRVREEWQKKIDAAKPADRPEIEKLRDQEVDDLMVIRDKLRGTFGLPDNPDTWTNRGLRLAKMYNAVTLLTGAIAAVPDVGRIVMYDGITRTYGTLLDTLANDVRAIREGRGMKGSLVGMANDEAELAGEALDMYMSMRATLFADLSDAMSATSGFERMAATATQQFFNVSLMNPWNVGVKTMASLVTGSRIIDESVKWSSAGRNSAGATVSYVDEIISTNTGSRIAARYNKKTNSLEVNLDELKKAYENKAWTNPRIKNVEAMPENQFKSFEEWRDFVIEHELAHADIRPRTVNGKKETRGAYEDRINKAALKRMGSRGQPSTPYEKTKLARAGIDENMAWRISMQFEEHGIRNGRVRIAKTANWTDREAAEAYSAALGKEINTIIVTPGAGDLPNVMSGGFERMFRERAKDLKAKRDAGEASMGERAELLFMSPQFAQIMFQFKSFGASATQRVLVPGLQNPDRNFLVGAGMAVGLGVIVSMLRNEQNGGRYQPTPDLIKDGIDRSGVLGYFSDLNGLVETFTDNRFGLGPLLGERERRSSGAYKAGAIFGPSVNQVQNLGRVVSGLSDGNIGSRDAGYVRRTLPMSRTFWADGVFDTFEDSITGTK